MDPRYSSITLFFSLIPLFAGIHGASAGNATKHGSIMRSSLRTCTALLMCRLFGGCLHGNLQRTEV